ncbi:peptide chain release factor 1 [bacterium]|nr:peptide chain release factor 1 [bacterium]
MTNQLTTLKEEYDQVKADLSNPAVNSDQKKVAKLAKRFSELEEIVNTSNLLEDINKKILENKEAVGGEDEDLSTIAEEELISLEAQQIELKTKLDELLIPKDPNDAKDVIVEIRAGTGGDEAALFAADLFRMYSHFAENKKWKLEILSTNRIGVGGYKEVIFSLSGNEVYGQLKYESGVHRVQRVPETEKSGRVHTSASTVAVLPEAEEVELEIKTEDLKIDVYRASGKGGQSVNTTDSAVRITHLPTNVVVACQDERSQSQNKVKAMTILRSRLLAAAEEEKQKTEGAMRKSQVGSGDRSEKIRTYNFPQDRVTDHRLGDNFSNIKGIMDGDIGPIIEALKAKQ